MLGTASGTLSAIREPYRQAYREPVNNLSSKALYRNFVGNLKPIEPYIGTLSETLSGNFETPIRNLVGNLKPETRNRKSIGNLVGNREGSSGKLPRHACLGTLLGNPVQTVDNPVGTLLEREPCLGTLFGNPVWEPCLETLLGNPVWEPCLGTLLETLLGTLLRTLLQTQQDSLHPRKTYFWHALPPSASPNLFSSKTLSKTVWRTLFLKSNTSGTL